MKPYNLVQEFIRTREVGEFISGALAGAMTKAVLAPLETIRLALANLLLFLYSCLINSIFSSFDVYKELFDNTE